MIPTARLLVILRAAIAKAGGQSAWASQHGISESYLSDVLLGRREPSHKISAVLGFTAVRGFVKVTGKGRRT